MGKYLKTFENYAAYSAAESGLILPNVSFCINENEVHYNPLQPAPVEPKYRWTNSGTTCHSCCKYNNQVYEVSNDNGNTWQIVTPVQTRMGTLIERYTVDCGWAAPISITNVSEELPTWSQITITLSRSLSESEMCCSRHTIERLFVEVGCYQSNKDEEEDNLSYIIEYFEFDENENRWVARIEYTYYYYEKVYNEETGEYEWTYEITDSQDINLLLYTNRWKGETDTLTIDNDNFAMITDIVMDV